MNDCLCFVDDYSVRADVHAGVFLTVDKPDRSKFETAGRELNQLIEQLGTVVIISLCSCLLCSLCVILLLWHVASQTPIRIAVKTLVAVRHRVALVPCKTLVN